MMIIGIISATFLGFLGLFVTGGQASLLPSCSDYPIVQTVNGPVRGYTRPGINGREYFAFTGIPYAKPPVGPLRFEAPQKPNNWTDILDVQQLPPYCLQKNYLQDRQVEGQEDCLYINVYVPKHMKHSLPLPVMVFIHYGGFFFGYATPDYEGPDYMLEKRDVIIVTMAYRLGIFGFITTNDDIAPGNYGLKDQALALQWVHENIENFSGDKNKVTIWGQSAGAGSVHFHMLSSLSRNLFQYAICESGSALAIWANPLDPNAVSHINRQQAQFVGCSDTDNMTAIIACLKQVPGDVLVESGDLFKFFDIHPYTVYLPTIETKTARNPNPFITKHPIDYIRAGEFAKVPLIIGLAQDDGRAFTTRLIEQSMTRETLNANFDDYLPQILGLSASTDTVPLLWDQINRFYFHGKSAVLPNDTSTFKAITDLITDRLFAYPAYQTALMHRLNGNYNIWFYNFNYTGQFSYAPNYSHEDTIADYKWGACHCDDLLYLFRTPALFDELSSPKDISMKDFLTNALINFADFGDPNGNASDPLWLRTNNNSPNFSKDILYLDIEGDWMDGENIQFKMKHNIHAERFKFWETLPLVENIPELDQNHLDITG